MYLQVLGLLVEALLFRVFLLWNLGLELLESDHD